MPRKQPLQARSRALVGVLLDALTRVLNRVELDETTTNAIAEQAGVSVGSLYQYFPSKQALVAALIRRQAQGDVDDALSLFQTAADQPLEVLVPQVVRHLVAHHRRHLKLYRTLLKLVPRLGQSDFVRGQVRQARAQFHRLLEARRAELRQVDYEVASFVLGVSVEASLHAAILERPDLLERPQFEQALSELCTRYLVTIPASPS
ncbi:MAG: TetR/AcrR family transcriptional regulator [Polyangiaceae bacterium]